MRKGARPFLDSRSCLNRKGPRRSWDRRCWSYRTSRSRCRLAGAVLAHERMDLAGHQLEADVAQRPHAGKVLAYADNGNDGSGHGLTVLSLRICPVPLQVRAKSARHGASFARGHLSAGAETLALPKRLLSCRHPLALLPVYLLTFNPKRSSSDCLALAGFSAPAAGRSARPPVSRRELRNSGRRDSPGPRGPCRTLPRRSGDRLPLRRRCAC